MNFPDAIIDAMGGLDDEIIAEIYEPKKKKRSAVVGAIAVAACAAIIIVGSGLLKNPPQIPDVTAPPVITQMPSETNVPSPTAVPQHNASPQPTATTEPQRIKLIINHGQSVNCLTAKTVFIGSSVYEEGYDMPEASPESITYDEIMNAYGISLDVQRTLPNYTILDSDYYSVEDVHNNVFEYSDGNGKLALSICHDGYVRYIPPDGMTATDIHGTSVVVAENDGVYAAEYSKDGLSYFIRADRLTEDEFAKLLEVLI